MVIHLRKLSSDTNVDGQVSHGPLHFIQLFRGKSLALQHSTPEDCCIGIDQENVSSMVLAVLVDQSLHLPVPAIKACDLRIAGNRHMLLFQFPHQPFHDTVHASFHIVVAIVPEFGIRKQRIYRGGVEGGTPEEKSHQGNHAAGFLRGEIAVYLLVEFSQKNGQMNGIHPHQRHNIIEERIEVLLNNHIDGIVEQLPAFLKVAFHFIFKVGLHAFELCSQLFDVLVEKPCFGTVAEVDRVKGIDFLIPERKFNPAFFGKLLKFV